MIDRELLNTTVSTSDFSQTFDAFLSFPLKSSPEYYNLLTQNVGCILNEVIDLSITVVFEM